MLARGASRAVVRAARPRPARGFAGHADSVRLGNPTKEWLETQASVEHHAEETTQLWRKISFFVAFPATLLTALWVRRVEAEHEAHEAHIKEEHGGELPPSPEYVYLNKRAKPFPWGMNSLFYNPHANKDMNDA